MQHSQRFEQETPAGPSDSPDTPATQTVPALGADYANRNAHLHGIDNTENIHTGNPPAGLPATHADPRTHKPATM